MKMNAPSLIILFVISILGCNKDNIIVKNSSASAFQSDQAVVSVCDKFLYADTIFYLKKTISDYIVKPLNTLSGTFGAYPTGLLRINATTGAINVTKSETGLKYLVWFIASGSTDTCKKFITISGVDYTDSVYTLNKTSVVAKPIYNANKLQSIDCSGGCVFDDGGAAAALGIAVNKTTGKIDLKATVQNGAFGKTPVNGSFVDFTLNYRIADKSSEALNKMALRLYYYASKAQVPAKLIEEVEAKKGQLISDDIGIDDGGGSHGGSGSGSSVSSTLNVSASVATNSLATGTQSKTTKCRPPYIIVTAK